MGIDGAGIRQSNRSRSVSEITGENRNRIFGESNPGFTALSRREREVLGLIALGMTDRQIADELIVSRVTISTHVAHILDKLGVPNRTAAVAHAIREARFAWTGD